MTFIQPIDAAEMVSIQKRIKLHHAALQRLYARAAGANMSDAANGIDDALSSLSFADDGIQNELDQASKGWS